MYIWKEVLQNVARLALRVSHHFDDIVAVWKEADAIDGGDGRDGVVVCGGHFCGDRISE